MKEIEYIVGVYNFFAPNPAEHNEASFFLLYLLDEKGMIDIEGAHDLFKEKFVTEFTPSYKVPAHLIGPFLSLEALNQYAFALCEELNAAQINLLSVADYNTLLENHQLASDFHQDLLEKGNVLENIERKKKGLLSRIFK